MIVESVVVVSAADAYGRTLGDIRGWLVFGHLVGVAVLAAGLGSYVAGLHRLSAARTRASLREAGPVIRWGEQYAITGVIIILATGVLLGFQVSAFDEAWLITSLVLFAVMVVSGRVVGVRLRRLLDRTDRGDATEDADETSSLLGSARSLAIHLPADLAVIIVLEILFLMAFRPGTWGIAASLVVAVLLVFGAFAVLSQSPAMERVEGGG